MGLPDLLRKRWSDTVTLGCIVVVAIIEAWQEAASSVPASVKIPRLDGWVHYVPLALLLIAGVVWVFGRRKKAGSLQLQTSQPPAIVPGIPALSALLGQNPTVAFDAKKFFALAHYSPVTAEIEQNIKTIAQQNSPNDKEAFYARFFGVGIVAYHHDVSWFVCFRQGCVVSGRDGKV